MADKKDYIDYNEATKWERFKYSLRTWRNIGVGKSLFIWFLAISFVPLAAVSFINFLTAYQGLTIVAEKSLNASSQLRLKYIYTFFNEASDFLEINISSVQKKQQFDKLVADFEKSGKSAAAYVKTHQWENLTKPLYPEIIPSLKLQGFYDFLFIDTHGNVLFTTKKEGALGINIFKGDMRETRLARTVKASLRQHKMLFSDLERFAPSMGIISGFFVQPVTDSQHRPIGVFALQITMKTINNMIQQEAGYGKTGQAYLIGDDLYLRSSTRFGDESEILRKKMINKKTLEWKDFLQHRDDKAYLKSNELDEERVTTYDATGKGYYVLGIYRNLYQLEKYGVHWALVEEISHQEAFAFARRLSDIAKISFLITILVVVLISILVTRWFVNPIKLLSSWGKEISTGKLSQKNIKAPKNEIGEMKDTFNQLVSSLKTYSDIARLVAKGDFSRQVEERSKDDVLAQSINKMVASFRTVVEQADRIANGDYDTLIKPRSGNDTLGKALYKMTDTLRKNAEKFRREDWLKTGLNTLDGVLKGKENIEELSEGIIRFFTTYLKAQVGLIYLFDEDKQQLKLSGTYAVAPHEKAVRKTYKPGEGLVGQAFKDRQRLLVSRDSDAEMPLIDMGMETQKPQALVVVPFSFENQVVGVMEMASVNTFSDLHLNFLDLAVQDLALAVITLQSHLKVRKLLEQTQEQAKILEVQQEELRQANEELQEQTEALKRSEENLQTQQEELKVTNEELEERTKALEIQRDAIKRKNKELEEARKEIEKKAKDLETASRYKSEFLANMSHELRTPLNSIIVLSQLLGENKNNNLSEKEREFARTINSSGNDLLNLINDILDLSKVESGKVEVNVERLYLDELVTFVETGFKPVIEEKGLELKIEKGKDLPDYVETDIQRVEQVIKNLISNAIKFTEQGSITFKMERCRDGKKLRKLGMQADDALALTVADTGIGIPKDKQDVIFEAFKQADGTTSRKYGGTGLGLSISKSFASLLGGAVGLESEENKGTAFTLYLPWKIENTEVSSETPETDISVKDTVEAEEKAETHSASQDVIKPASGQSMPVAPADVPTVEDDRENLQDGDKKILIIEDDVNFATVLRDLAHEHHYKAIIALDGEIGLYHADYYQPDAIILDLGLPGIDGMEVIDHLKANVRTRAIPVHVISASDFDINLLKKGAIGFLSKPVTKEQIDDVFAKIEHINEKPLKRLLVVEDEEITRKSIEKLLKDDTLEIVSVESGEQAVQLLKKEPFDCMVLDLGLKDMTGFDVLEKIQNDESAREVPVVIYTSHELSREENDLLKKYGSSIILKGAHSFERLLDETTLFLHQVDTDFTGAKKKMSEKVYHENSLKGKTILLVDDDMRNVFALSSVLESYDMKVVVGKNGKEAIEKLHQHADDIDLVLMDIMMPEMNGYEAMQLIRKEKRFEKLPIIALTAKAMKGDREKCIAAGANEYLSKPVDKEKLISMLRVWLYK
jgi:CheY-like chemotaxis protein/signal transduction histidine kinase/HAMP domain-containing protein